MKSKCATLILLGAAACGPMYGPSQPPAPAPAPPARAPVAQPDPPPPPQYPDPPPRPRAQGLPAEAKLFVDAHNVDRAKHCAQPLTWSPKLAEIAQDWAKSLVAQGCKFGHSGGPTGENLAAGTSGTLDAVSVTAMWYDEIADYRFPDGGFSMKTGHFTQVVWRGTTQLGCAHASCNGMDIFVCEYDAPGNVEGEYRENVKPAGCR